MTITPQDVITWGTLLGTLGVIVTAIFKLVHWVDRQKEQDKELLEIKESHDHDNQAVEEELTVICFGLLAALDGLKQLGANGNVTKAHDALEKHMNKKAHK